MFLYFQYNIEKPEIEDEDDDDDDDYSFGTKKKTTEDQDAIASKLRFIIKLWFVAVKYRISLQLLVFC